MDTRINEADMQHLNAFPDEQKTTLMQRIMAHEPDKTQKLEGRNDFEKTLLRLRKDGYQLIDLQRQELAFSSVWFCRGEGMLERRRAEAAMLVWEQQDEGTMTTVMTWWL